MERTFLTEKYVKELFEAINKVKRIFRKIHNENELYTQEFMTMVTIHHLMEEKKEMGSDEPGAKVGELAAYMHSTKSATSKMLRNIEEKGYIERINDTKDRRNVYIRLSDVGDDVRLKARNKGIKYTNEVISELGVEDTENLIRIIQKLNNIMEKKVTTIKQQAED